MFHTTVSQGKHSKQRKSFSEPRCKGQEQSLLEPKCKGQEQSLLEPKCKGQEKSLLRVQSVRDKDTVRPRSKTGLLIHICMCTNRPRSRDRDMT